MLHNTNRCSYCMDSDPNPSGLCNLCDKQMNGSTYAQREALRSEALRSEALRTDAEVIRSEQTARERQQYDEAARHFGVDIMALRYYFPNGRP